jgi:anti-sigma B factor antagonist
MKILKRDVGSVTILEPKGKITIGSGDIRIREAIEEAASGGGKNVLVNLQRVSKMDSSGLGELVSGYNAVTAGNGAMKLTNLPSKLYNVLGAAQMLSIFEVFDNVDEALASFDQ